MRIGVLALQGDFERHQQALQRLGIETVLVRKPGQLLGCDGLVLPGGESTTFVRLMREAELWEPLKQFCDQFPVFGTCAGLIVLAAELVNQAVDTLGAIDISVRRNAYGRQRESFVGEVALAFGEDRRPYEGVFIRAPKIVRVGPSVTVLGTHRDEPVLVTNGTVLAATFHPELTQDLRIHSLFVEMVRGSLASRKVVLD
ncbi:MAG: pyridoxal 5'-phosphate synthase glutaminase subunit PdxT [candidate division KSB1 bacterium]|nr:pyridoxal 5'-phosphate synthase glutaminase subunit PdxT [candidate division KSB1 bacterium]